MCREISSKELSEILSVSPPLNLKGALTLLSEEININLPVVFLFDEHHQNLNGCINKNISNAIELINNLNVNIVGVESLAGGIEWDLETEDYVTDDDNIKLYIEDLQIYNSGISLFSDTLSRDYEELIYGVESIGMRHKIIEYTYRNCKDCSAEERELYIEGHLLNGERSKHFIKTLSKLRELEGQSGNLILNCGRNHNTRIQELVNNAEIINITNIDANYIRIDTIR